MINPIDRHSGLRAIAKAAQRWPTGLAVVELRDLSALLADYDRMQDALWLLAEHNALHFGEVHNTVDLARAALAQGGSDAT